MLAQYVRDMLTYKEFFVDGKTLTLTMMLMLGVYGFGAFVENSNLACSRRLYCAEQRKGAPGSTLRDPSFFFSCTRFFFCARFFAARHKLNAWKRLTLITTLPKHFQMVKVTNLFSESINR